MLLQEFINYFFLQRASAADAGNLEDWRLHAEVGGRWTRRPAQTAPQPSATVGCWAPPQRHLPLATVVVLLLTAICPPKPPGVHLELAWLHRMQDYWRKEYRGASHKEAVENIYCCDPLGQYITGGRGGVLR